MTRYRLRAAAGTLAVLVLPCLAAGYAPHRGPPQPPPTDSIAVESHARAAADTFVAAWRYYWEASEEYRHIIPPTRAVLARAAPPRGIPAAALTAAESAHIPQQWAAAVPPNPVNRQQLAHCHETLASEAITDPWRTLTRVRFTRLDAYIIESSAPGRAVCPSWFPPSAMPPWDESESLDGAILSQLLPLVHVARSRLLTTLDAAERALPGDEWIVGQNVRFLLDASDTAAAGTAIAACRATAWWCTALGGYLASVRHDVVGADSAFAAAVGAMPEPDRCEWTDLGPLLDDAGRRAYAAVPCADRDTLNARIWWLADPLYVEPGNERRVDHYARQMLFLLRSGTVTSERWDMTVAGGGTAVREMLLRYGWPSFTYWPGRPDDQAHDGFLKIVADSERHHGVLATAEYSLPRFQAIPAWAAVADPGHAQALAWTLAPTSWPREHFQRAAGPMIGLETQTAMFRRQDSILVAMATNLWATDFAGADGDTLRGAIALSSGPDSITLKAAAGVVGYSSSFRTMVAPRPQILSLELLGAHPSGVAARTRFGLTPPVALSGMHPGEIAISDPAFIQPISLDEDLPRTEDTALPRMYGTTAFNLAAPGRGVGVYWETYGIAAGEPVDITLQVSPSAPSDALKRQVGIQQSLVPGRDTVAFQWHEPDPAHQVTTIGGLVPIQSRSVALNVAQLAPGTYTLSVTITHPGSAPVSSSREFAVVKGK